jgi:hypothetical protein
LPKNPVGAVAAPLSRASPLVSAIRNRKLSAVPRVRKRRSAARTMLRVLSKLKEEEAQATDANVQIEVRS